MARESDGILEDFAAAFDGQKYVFQGAKDGDAWTKMRKNFSVKDIRSRWRFALRRTDWLQARTVAQLGGKWNDINAAFMGEAAPERPDAYECQKCAASVDVATVGRRWVARAKRWVCPECFGAWLTDLLGGEA